MAQQFSLPQEQVLEELDGEGSSWQSLPRPALGTPSHPLIPWEHPLRGRDRAQLSSAAAPCCRTTLGSPGEDG